MARPSPEVEEKARRIVRHLAFRVRLPVGQRRDGKVEVGNEIFDNWIEAMEALQKRYDPRREISNRVDMLDWRKLRASEADASIAPDSVSMELPALWEPTAIQPPEIPPDDEMYQQAELEAKAAVEALVQSLGATIRQSGNAIVIDLPEGFTPAESPEFLSWQQAREWLGAAKPSAPTAEPDMMPLADELAPAAMPEPMPPFLGADIMPMRPPEMPITYRKYRLQKDDDYLDPYEQEKQREQEQYELEQQREQEQYEKEEAREYREETLAREQAKKDAKEQRERERREEMRLRQLRAEEERQRREREAARILAELGVRPGAYGHYSVGSNVYDSPSQALEEILAQRFRRQEVEARRRYRDALLRWVNSGAKRRGEPPPRLGESGVSYQEYRMQKDSPLEDAYEATYEPEKYAQKQLERELAREEEMERRRFERQMRFEEERERRRMEREARRKLAELGVMRDQGGTYRFGPDASYTSALDALEYLLAYQAQEREKQAAELYQKALAEWEADTNVTESIAAIWKAKRILDSRPIGREAGLTYQAYRQLRKGGPGSGHFGHEGRPGKVGGSLPSDDSDGDRGDEKSAKPRNRTPKGEKERAWKEYLPEWYGGIYDRLLRQYILGRPKKPPELPPLSDLTPAQRQELEKMIENQDLLVYAGAESTILPKALTDNVLRPAAQKVADAIDFMTYDHYGRRLQNYVNFAVYLLGIKARGNYKQQVAERIRAENEEIRRANAARRDPPQTGWIDKRTGEVIPLDDPRVPQPPASAEPGSQEYRDYVKRLARFEQRHVRDPAFLPQIPEKELPRWLFPKTEAGHFASYIFNPWSLAGNVAASLFMAHVLPQWSKSLKQYAQGDPRAFNQWLDNYLKRQADTSEASLREAELYDEDIEDVEAMWYPTADDSAFYGDALFEEEPQLELSDPADVPAEEMVEPASPELTKIIDDPNRLVVPSDEASRRKWLQAERELMARAENPFKEDYLKPIARKLAEIFEDLTPRDKVQLPDAVKAYLGWLYRPADFDRKTWYGRRYDPEMLVSPPMHALDASSLPPEPKVENYPRTEWGHKKWLRDHDKWYYEDWLKTQPKEVADVIRKKREEFIRRNPSAYWSQRYPVPPKQPEALLRSIGDNPLHWGLAKLLAEYTMFPHLAEQFRKYVRDDPSAFNPLYIDREQPTMIQMPRPQ